MEVLNFLDKFFPYVSSRMQLREDAEDFMQDIKEVILLRKDFFESKPFTDQKNLAFVMLRNRLIDRHRYFARQKKILENAEPFYFHFQRPEAYAKIELKEIFTTRNWKGVLLLASGYSLKEIAMKLGGNVNSNNQLNSNTRKNLKKNYFYK